MEIINREDFNFSSKVEKHFGFLKNIGFSIVDSQPTFVKYAKDSTIVDVYHGRKSYDVSLGIFVFGERYSISEVIASGAPPELARFRNKVVKEPAYLDSVLVELSLLLKKYGMLILQGNIEACKKLENYRKMRSEQYSKMCLVKQIRPAAEKAFREKKYSKATELYLQIQESLTKTEVEKLNYAKKNSM